MSPKQTFSNKKKLNQSYLLTVALLSIGSLTGCVYCIPSLLAVLSIPVISKLTQKNQSLQQARVI